MQENINIPDSNITTNLTFRNLVLMNMQQLTNFPYIENDFDALTDYQLLCLIVKYLNDVITNSNEQNDSITNLYNAFLSLQTYVNNTKDTLENAFNSLDNYVRDYFANLNVQDEINNKLDQMATDGSLTLLIKNYVDPIYQEYENSINTEVSSFKTTINGEITTINNKVNAATSGSPKGVYSTVSDLESDNPDHDYIYVVTATGNWYYYDTSSSEWTSGGSYQSTGIADGSVTYDMLDTNLYNDIVNLEDTVNRSFTSSNTKKVNSYVYEGLTTGTSFTNSSYYFNNSIDKVNKPRFISNITFTGEITKVGIICLSIDNSGNIISRYNYQEFNVTNNEANISYYVPANTIAMIKPVGAISYYATDQTSTNYHWNGSTSSVTTSYDRNVTMDITYTDATFKNDYDYLTTYDDISYLSDSKTFSLSQGTTSKTNYFVFDTDIGDILDSIHIDYEELAGDNPNSRASVVLTTIQSVNTDPDSATQHILAFNISSDLDIPFYKCDKEFKYLFIFVENSSVEVTFNVIKNRITALEKDINKLKTYYDYNTVLMGDSITDTNVNGKWVTSLLTKVSFKSLNNYARGYCTWTFKNDSSYNIVDTSNTNVGNNIIWNQFNRLVNDVDNNNHPTPDLIIILAGTNDAIQSKTIGNINTTFDGESILDKDITTLTNLCQSIRYTIEAIRAEYPDVKIVLTTPNQLANYSTNNYNLLVRNAILDCCKYLSCEYIDQFGESGIYQYYESVNHRFLDSGGVHPTNLGGNLISSYIIEKLDNIKGYKFTA